MPGAGDRTYTVTGLRAGQAFTLSSCPVHTQMPAKATADGNGTLVFVGPVGCRVDARAVN